MIQLFGLMCLVAGDPSTCSAKEWKETFPTIEACEQVGQAQLGSPTPWGIVVGFKCEAAGEPV